MKQMINVGDILGLRYEIISQIGRGGMSTVYRAFDQKLNRYVAIKVLKEEFSGDEEFVYKFRKEAQSVASLIHPNIVAAYDAVDEGNLHYIVMELVEGKSLKHRIQHHGAIDSERALEIALQTAEGIAAAHKNGIIHRDIKPQNIILARDGSVKVADFGIAKAVTGETISTAVLGSAHYVSPEQAKKGVSDARSDIYSLGITMYEMVTGSLPFDGENTVSVVMAHINKPLPVPEEVNPSVYPALSDIILKTTRKNPNDRYQTAEELIEDLKRCKEDPEGDFVFPQNSEHSGSSGNSGNQKETEKPDHKRPQRNSLFNELVNKKVIAGLILAAAALILILIVVFTNQEETPSVLASSPEEKQEESSNEGTAPSIEIAEEQMIPNVIGLSSAEAQRFLNDNRLTMVVEKQEYNDVYLEDIVIAQSPQEGEKSTDSSIVYVTVSLGSKLDSVLKSLKGLTVDEATDRLKEVEVEVLRTERQISDDVSEGLVIGYLLDNEAGQEVETDVTSPTGGVSEELTGSKVLAGSSIILLVSAGKESENTHMPSLIGLGVSEAAAVLESNGLGIADIAKVPSGETRDGKITAQSVVPNEIIRIGSQVNIQVNMDADTILSYEVSQTDAYDEDETLSPDFYYGSIDTVCQIGFNVGPADEQQSRNIGIRLHQRLADNDEYSIIMEPRPIRMGSKLPVCYRSIRGAYGIDKGTVEVYDADTQEVLMSTDIMFFPLGE